MLRRLIGQSALVLGLVLPALSAAENFELEMYAAGLERVVRVEDRLTIRFKTVTVEAGILDRWHGNETQPYKAEAGEVIIGVETDDSGCGHREVECFSIDEDEHEISCRTSGMRAGLVRVKAHLRCTTSCCTGFYKVSVLLRTVRQDTPDPFFDDWDTRDLARYTQPESIDYWHCLLYTSPSPRD